MDAARIEILETGARFGASALFATAVGYAGYGLSVAIGAQPQLSLCAIAAAAALAYLSCSHLLRIAGGQGEAVALPGFAVPEWKFLDGPDELLLSDRVVPDKLLLTDDVGSAEQLLLTDADRLDPPASPGSQAPLELNDILAEIGPEARVVRLFDRSAMPTPGQLQSGIAAHLADGAPCSAPSSVCVPPNASQALSAALAELRRSLR